MRQEKRAVPGFDPHRGTADPAADADILLIGAGTVGSVVAPVFAQAGLKVVALEPGPFRSHADYLPDELGATYYCRGNMGSKFLSEVPRWRRNEGEVTQEATFSLGRMMNSVGGSVIHYGGWLRRFHPHHFKMLSHVKSRWGLSALPPGCTLADWPLIYEELEPYYTYLEHAIGIAGDESNPFIQRSKPLPMPPMRPFRLGKLYREATERMALHPHPVAVGVNTVPYRDRPATTYCAWSNLRENEHRLADWMEAKSEEILRQMGATRTWRGDRFTGVGSSHDFGGARMGEDCNTSVVSPELEVHDTPGLYVFSGATFPTRPGINPTLSLLALSLRAAERLVKQLTTGDHS